MIFYPQFLAPISQFVHAAAQGHILLFKDPFLDKSSKANQFEILGANAKHKLSLHLNRNTLKKPMEEVFLSDSKEWRKSHLKTIETSYRKAAFYQFYDYKLHPLFVLDVLFEAVLTSYKLCFDALNLEVDIEWTDTKPEGINPQDLHFKQYDQVFSEKLGFHSNLSIIDLIYNQGPMARDIIL